ncbi:hypothetical protein [Agarivorans gilvus]|uniref:Uncharacterized protein n=1 Tax=Agarivorans gilvus TaxID=680279 RepID=A0ABQ1I0F3_9ALTE|nr:hypothetical protein [Agarivorans gilvus]GGB04629.1 hypothetical protein GCM10007414_17370 [Agarivorans gilvus]
MSYNAKRPLEVAPSITAHCESVFKQLFIDGSKAVDIQAEYSNIVLQELKHNTYQLDAAFDITNPDNAYVPFAAKLEPFIDSYQSVFIHQTQPDKILDLFKQCIGDQYFNTGVMHYLLVEQSDKSKIDTIKMLFESDKPQALTSPEFALKPFIDGNKLEALNTALTHYFNRVIEQYRNGYYLFKRARTLLEAYPEVKPLFQQLGINQVSVELMTYYLARYYYDRSEYDSANRLLDYFMHVEIIETIASPKRWIKF